MPSSEDRAGDRPPLWAHAALCGTYVATVGTALACASPSRLRSTPSWRDTLLLGVATSSLARLITLDAVTAPFRAPFTRYEGPSGAGEVRESPRGRGLRHAIGELVTCPFCAAPWVAGVLFLALVHRPRKTRLVASVLSAVMVSDFLNQAYAFARQRS